ncbi:hypothetical protein diail_11216 [Diaporthe ilicicola]|nr:hypothetical protein diail_11216 [Diaporthe ilicicola]
MERKLVFLLLLSQALGHTWLESIRLIGTNGAFTGDPGFPRGFVGRTDPSFSDDALTYRITARDESTPLCHPSQQVANGYSNPLYPRSNASAGSFIGLQYGENGHVSAPQVPEGRPYRSGNIYIYGTTSLRDEKFTSVHGNWTADGSLESGRLLASHFFDDEVCFQDQGSQPTQINAERKNAAGLFSVNCQTDFQIPQEISSDILAVYWVWEWDLWPNMNNVAPEAYTACSEINISPGEQSQSDIVFDESIPLDQRAVQSQLAAQFEVFQLGTGTAAPPLVTSLYSSPASAGSPSIPPTNATMVSSLPVTTSPARTGFTTVYVPSATVTVTVKAVVAP